MVVGRGQLYGGRATMVKIAGVGRPNDEVPTEGGWGH